MAVTSLLLFISIVFSYLPSNLEAFDGFSINFIHRDSPCSPLYNSSETPSDRVSRAIRGSNSRISHFLSKHSASHNTVASRVINDAGVYLMKISLGTPPVQILAVADTGSDLIWTQCHPCDSCYQQHAPLFDPSQSSTYGNLSCTSQPCTDLAESSTCGTRNSCEYSYRYGDESFTYGVLATETFTMDSTRRVNVKLPMVAFGCGHKDGGSFDSDIDGIVGLGAGPLSLISQLGSSIDEKFAYCLVPLGQNNSSRLEFGKKALVSGKGAVSTPLFSKKSYKTLYFLALEKIAVGDQIVSLPSSSDGDDGNIVIDSGTTLTYLPVSVYQDLVSALKKVIDLPPAQDPLQYLNPCYEGGPDTKFPNLKFRFRGADVVLRSVNTFVQVADNVMCFAFMAADDLSILGNVAQQNFRIGYDLHNRKVMFRPTDCAKTKR